MEHHISQRQVIPTKPHLMLLIGMFWLQREIQEIPAQQDQQVLPVLQALQVLMDRPDQQEVTVLTVRQAQQGLPDLQVQPDQPERRLALEHLPLPPDLLALLQVVLLRQRYLLSVFLLARLVQQDQQVLQGQPDLQGQPVLQDPQDQQVMTVQTAQMVRRRASERRPPPQDR